MTQRYHPYDPADPKPATMYPAVHRGVERQSQNSGGENGPR